MKAIRKSNALAYTYQYDRNYPIHYHSDNAGFMQGYRGWSLFQHQVTEREGRRHPAEVAPSSQR